MDATGWRVAVRAVTALIIMALVAACQATRSADKAGGDTAVLKLATFEDEPNANGQNYGPQAFVDNLGKVSGGRLKVELKTDYGNGAPEAESTIVKAIASGAVDGGWPSTRAFANGGIKGLEVAEAPMTIASYAAQKALVSGPVADKLLARLDGSGVVGLGLAVGPLRRPFAAKAPLLGPEDWKGVSFRVFNSPVQADVVRALGATPANLSLSWTDAIHAGTLRGAEFEIAQYERMGLGQEAGNITANVVLWPKFVLALSKQRFDALTPQQQGWVRAAAKQAVKASVDATYDEATAAQTLCGRGVRLADATLGQLQGLQAKLRPVLDRLATNPTSAQLLRDIRAIAAQHPGPEPLAVPAACRRAVTTNSRSLGPVPTTVSALPEGVYRTEVSQADVAAAGGDPGDHPAGIWTLTVRRGTYEVRCRPVPGPGQVCGGTVEDRPLEVGDLRGTGKVVYFVPNAERLSRLTGCKLPVSNTLDDHCGPDDPYRVAWTISSDKLTLSEVPGSRGGNIGTWRKIN